MRFYRSLPTLSYLRLSHIESLITNQRIQLLVITEVFQNSQSTAETPKPLTTNLQQVHISCRDCHYQFTVRLLPPKVYMKDYRLLLQVKSLFHFKSIITLIKCMSFNLTHNQKVLEICRKLTKLDKNLANSRAMKRYLK